MSGTFELSFNIKFFVEKSLKFFLFIFGNFLLHLENFFKDIKNVPLIDIFPPKKNHSVLSDTSIVEYKL